MNKKYINENRYKKSTSKKRRDFSAIRKTGKVSTKKKKNTKKITNKPRLRPSVRKELRITRRNVFSCIILVIIILVILRALFKEEGEPFFPIFFGDEENTQVISIGVITDEDLLDDNINNVILKELSYYSNHMLLKVNKDYSLDYDAIKSIEKSSGTEYILHLNESKEYDANSIKTVLDGYINDKTSVYHLQLNNIKNISVLDKQKLKITLKNNDPYFIYNLDIPIAKTDKKLYKITENSTSTSVEYEKTKYAKDEAPKKILVKRFKDMYSGVEEYKKGTINILITNQKNVNNILGKYEYNLKTYRNGETIFLFLNQSSDWLKNEEIRKVIAYSIDRDNIVKEVMQSSANIIDLPFIYDSVKYKYDIYAAENLLLSNGYKKSNKVYTKKGKQVVLNLLVNKSDLEKVEIATAIMNNLSAIGIKVNVEKLTTTDIQNRIKKGTYDLVLSTVNLNNKPDITFLSNNLYITNELKDKILMLNEVLVSNISKEIKDVSMLMSNSIACIGIGAKTNYVIYNKEINLLNDISYLNVINSLGI